MHNLFLGTAKNVFKLWIKKDFLSKKELKVLEDKINSLDVGTGIGRLSQRIALNYGGYTASQWKNWTLIYSMFCLKHLLPETHLRCWQTFVCQYLCTPVLSKTDLLKADLLLVKFGERFKQLWPQKCTFTAIWRKVSLIVDQYMHFGVLALNSSMEFLVQCKWMEGLWRYSQCANFWLYGLLGMWNFQVNFKNILGHFSPRKSWFIWKFSWE